MKSATRKRPDAPETPALSLETAYTVASAPPALAQIEQAIEDEMRRYRRCHDCPDAIEAALRLQCARDFIRDAAARLRRRQGEAERVVMQAGPAPF